MSSEDLAVVIVLAVLIVSIAAVRITYHITNRNKGTDDD